MKIAFDPQIFSLQPYGGISRYFVETATRLAALPDTEVSVLAFAHLNAYLAAAPQGAVVGRSITVLPQSARSTLARVNVALARSWLARHPVDIVHETYYSPRPLSRSGKAKTVVTVLDMIHEKFPSLSAGSNRVMAEKRAAVERADHIVCISENTRRDLIECLGVAPERTSVVLLGFSLQVSIPMPPGPPPVLGGSPYVLFVGKRGDYKNFVTLLRAYAASTNLRKDFLLVCFGDEPFNQAELNAARELGIGPDRLRHFRGNDDQLALFYRHAALFVYPSRYEGFGIPPLEAMSFDCPVVCSNTSSLPEVVGDAARTVDPDDADALRLAMEAVLGEKDLADDLRRRGRRRVAMFSWDECARQTRAVYASLLSK
jgi:glycosyltransferase involved in cell wall biosynthesis